MKLYTALIRTHHITSRKKVSSLRDAAKRFDVACLLRIGGSPGVMYVEGEEEKVKAWIGEVQHLRYKDFQLSTRPTKLAEAIDFGRPTTTTPTPAPPTPATATKATTKSEAQERERDRERRREGNPEVFRPGSLEEVESVKAFGEKMQRRGVWEWWRVGMGFAGTGEGLL